MNEHMRCLSTHGQFLIFDKASGELRTSPDPHHPNVIFAEISGSEANLYFFDSHRTWFVMPGNFGTAIYDTPQKIAGKLKTAIVDDEFIYFSQNGQYLSADPDGAVNFKVWKEVYERFWLCADASLPFLVSNNSWYSTALKQIIEKEEIRFLPGFKIEVGGIQIDIKTVIKYGHSPDGKEVHLIYDGYKAEKLLLFKPLIYFSAYGKEQSFLLLRMCIESMESFGSYKGDYLIISNKQESYIRGLIDFVDPARLHIIGISIVDETDMVCARFKITESDVMSPYQPILYSDFDIICNNNINDLLGDIVGGDPHSQSSIYVKSEGPLDHPSYGSVLTFADSHAVLGRGDRFSNIRSPIGFNSGVIGFRNSERVRADFLSVINCIYAQIENGISRQSAEVYDQPAANYVYNKISSYDVGLIDKYIHPWPPLDNEKIQGAGLVHFCGGVGPTHKIDRMTSYYEFIKAQLK